MTNSSKKRKIYGLRYRMKKKGYRFDGRKQYCYMPDDPTNRSKLMERRLVSLGYGIEYNMLHLFAENGGVTVFCALCFVRFFADPFKQPDTTNLIEPTRYDYA